VSLFGEPDVRGLALYRDPAATPAQNGVNYRHSATLLEYETDVPNGAADGC
jgi:hypothetical protein